MEEFENLSLFWRTVEFTVSPVEKEGPSGLLYLALDESSNGYGCQPVTLQLAAIN